MLAEKRYFKMSLTNFKEFLGGRIILDMGLLQNHCDYYGENETSSIRHSQISDFFYGFLG